MSKITGLDQVQRRLDLYVNGLRNSAREAAAEIAELLANYAKTHHDWQPQTGNTDNSTMGTVQEVEGEVIRIILSAGMDYDVFLELARSGRWAWLFPAVQACAGQIRSILISKLGKANVQ